MRAVVRTAPGKIELAFMMLPMFIGLDSGLKKEIEEKLSKEIVGKPMTDELLDDVNERVLDVICQKHAAIIGLRDYISSLKYVEQMP